MVYTPSVLLPSTLSMLTNEDLSLESLIVSMKKKPMERNAKDLTIINKYLQDTELAQKFKDDKIEEHSLDRILYFCSMYVQHKFLDWSQILFRFGDPGDKFFIILKGRVTIYKPIKEQVKMTAVEYYDYLKKLRDMKENALVKMSLNINNHIFPVDFKHIDELEDISFKVRYRKTLIFRPSVVAIQKIFEESKRDPGEYDVDFNELSEVENNRESFNNHIQRQLSILSSDQNLSKKMDKYRYVENDLEKKLVTVFHLENFLELHAGKYFGDYALEGRQTRSATIVAGEESHFGVLDISVYREYIQIEKHRLVMKEVSFFLDNFFFSSIKKKMFEKKYFQMFIVEDYYRGASLFKENEEAKFLYLLKDGEVELTINRNILELHKIVKTLLDLKLLDSDKVTQYQIKNDPKNIMDELSKKKLIKLFLYGEKELFGLEEFFFNLNCLYSAKIVSDKARIYRIDFRNVQKILNEEKDCLHFAEKMAKEKMIKFIKRLLSVKNISLEMLDENVKEKNNLEKLKAHSQVQMKENHIFNSFRVNMENKRYLSQRPSKLTLNKTNTLKNDAMKTNLHNVKDNIMKAKSEDCTINMNENSRINNTVETHHLGKISLPKIHHKEDTFNYEENQIKKLKKELKSMKNPEGVFSVGLNSLTPKKKKYKGILQDIPISEKIKISFNQKENSLIYNTENSHHEDMKTISSRKSDLNNKIAYVNFLENSPLKNEQEDKIFKHLKKLSSKSPSNARVNIFNDCFFKKKDSSVQTSPEKKISNYNLQLNEFAFVDKDKILFLKKPKPILIPHSKTNK